MPRARHPVRGRPRRHGGDRRERLRGHPRDAAADVERRRVRHRARGPGQAGDADRLAGARGVPGHARLLHGRPAARRGSPSSSIAGGRPPSEPVAIVQRGTFPDQREVERHARDDRAGRRRGADQGAGDHDRRRGRRAVGDRLAWRRQARPLAGVSVAVTRARAQASALAGRLRGLGAHVVEAPGDPRRAARGRPPGPQRLRPAVRHEPQRRRAADGPRARRARPRRPDDRRDRAGHRSHAPRARHRGGHRAGRARSPSRSSRRWPTCPSRAR